MRARSIPPSSPPHHQVHRNAGHSLALGLACVALRLRHRQPPEDRHELMGRCPVFGCRGGARLAQPVGTAGHPSLDAPVAEPVAEAPDRVRRPDPVTRKVMPPAGLASITCCSSGKMGISVRTGLRLRFFCWVNFSHPSRACCRPRCTTSERRTPVHSSSASARRALEPTGWCSSN